MRRMSIAGLFTGIAMGVFGALNGGAAIATSDIPSVQTLGITDPVAAEIAKNLEDIVAQEPLESDQSLQAGNYIYDIVSGMRYDEIRADDHIFAAAKSLAASSDRYVRKQAEELLVMAAAQNESYAREVLGMTLSPAAMIRAVAYAIGSHATLRDQGLDMFEQMLQSGDQSIMGDVMLSISIYFGNVKDTTYHPKIMSMLEAVMDDGLDGEYDDPWLTYMAMARLQEAVESYGGLPVSEAERLFAKIAAIPPGGVGGDYNEYPLYFAQSLAKKHAPLNGALFALAKTYLDAGDAVDGETRAAAVANIAAAAAQDETLRRETVDILKTLTTDKDWEVKDTSILQLGTIAKNFSSYHREIFDHLAALPVTQGTVGRLLLALGYIGEADAAYARLPFEMAQSIISSSEYQGIEAGPFEVAYALEVAGAMGVAHEELREEAVTTLTGAIAADSFGRWQDDSDFTGIAYSAAAEIAVLDESYAKRVVDAAASADYGDPYMNMRAVAGAAMDGCLALEYANTVLAEKFGTAADADVKTYAGKVQDYLLQETGNDAQACLAKQEAERQKYPPRDTNIQSFIILH